MTILEINVRTLKKKLQCGKLLYKVTLNLHILNLLLQSITLTATSGGDESVRRKSSPSTTSLGFSGHTP